MPPEKIELRLARILGILMDYSGRGWVTLDEIAERFDISRAALVRDLDIAQWCGIPPLVEYHDFIQVVVEEELGEVEIMVPNDIGDRARLTGGERIALLTAARVVLELRPHDSVLATAIDKAREQLDIGGDLHVELEKPPMLGAFLDAEEGHRVVIGRYWSAHSDEVKARRLEPHAVFYGGGNWYARCRDCEDGHLKLFRIDRFASMTVTDEVFEPIELEESLLLFHAGETAEPVTVRFPDTARWVLEVIDAELVTDDGGGGDGSGFTAELTVVGRSWLEALLLQTGGVVQSPEHLTTLGPDAARWALAYYEPG